MYNCKIGAMLGGGFESGLKWKGKVLPGFVIFACNCDYIEKKLHFLFTHTGYQHRTIYRMLSTCKTIFK